MLTDYMKENLNSNNKKNFLRKNCFSEINKIHFCLFNCYINIKLLLYLRKVDFPNIIALEGVFHRFLGSR